MLLGIAAGAEPAPESYQVSTPPPRLLLPPRRLRLLKRERERQSMRWQQFDALMSGKARMAEPGFALALYHQVSGEREAGRRAVQWALGPAEDLRQLALVFDWCKAVMEDAEAAALAAKLQRGVERAAQPVSVATARDRVLAAVALADRLPKVSEAGLRAVVEGWWRARVVPALMRAQPIPRQDHYPLFELLHALRDNLDLDLRQTAPKFFQQLPLYQLISYYPAPHPAAENNYRIHASRSGGADPEAAALSRAAEMAMVAYEPNAEETQYLQGWVMHDEFLMRGVFGITYEFLWANPYHPGLSYHNLPPLLHDETFGRLFLRSNWNDDADWLGWFDGQLQRFEKGRRTVVSLAAASRQPIEIGGAVVLVAGLAEERQARRLILLREGGGPVFILGLKPRQRYDVEVDDEEMREERTDAGGILRLPDGTHGGIRLRLAP